MCLKEDNIPIGYVNVDANPPYDFGYGLRREFWGHGFITEAGAAVLEEVKKAGLPYVSATHDVNNPASGRVMQKLGLHYCYSYQEQWQPKDIPVIFRLYQMNFEMSADFVYRDYWNHSSVRFVESD